MATLLPPKFHPAMFKTLYKIATPQISVHDAEYYQPMVATAVVNGKSMYFVRETHGWFDGAEKRAASVTETLFYQEELESGAEAAKLFDQQVQHRVNEGFAHSFSVDPYTGMAYEYLGKGDRG
jgi:hypothetical protein